jgi:hypothetical protein
MPKCATKREGQILHAQKRARQRFGLYFSEHQLDQLAQDIQTQKLKFLERQSLRITVWLACIEEMEIVLVYDSKRQVVTTLIPYEWWKGDHECENTRATKRTPIVQFSAP